MLFTTARKATHWPPPPPLYSSCLPSPFHWALTPQPSLCFLSSLNLSQPQSFCISCLHCLVSLCKIFPRLDAVCYLNLCSNATSSGKPSMTTYSKITPPVTLHCIVLLYFLHDTHSYNMVVLRVLIL